jgi:tRNA (adenine57-N1/adenine58-N1)-methyltransferase catalytic subunit
VSETALLADGESVLFIDSKSRPYLRRLRAGKVVALRGGGISADGVIGQPEGHFAESARGERYLVLRPTYAQLIPQLPRRAQPIYPKDTGAILLWGDIGPGMTVVEVGIGPGALTLALLRAVGPTGQVISCELRPDFAAAASENVERFHGAAPNWTLHVADAFAGIPATGVDRMVVDLAEPWRLLTVAATTLRPGGVFTGYIPTAMQLKHLVDGLVAHGGFAAIETLELFARGWHVRGLSVRPEHRMVAHTGFLVFARRLAPGAERPPTVHRLTPSDAYSTAEERARSLAPDEFDDDEGGDPPDGLAEP